MVAWDNSSQQIRAGHKACSDYLSIVIDKGNDLGSEVFLYHDQSPQVAVTVLLAHQKFPGSMLLDPGCQFYSMTLPTKTTLHYRNMFEVSTI